MSPLLVFIVARSSVMGAGSLMDSPFSSVVDASCWAASLSDGLSSSDWQAASMVAETKSASAMDSVVFLKALSQIVW